MEIRSVEIEFTEDTFGADGNVVRNKGDKLWVDKRSAHSFVDTRKVAKRVGEGPTLHTDRRVPKRKPKPKEAKAEAEEAPADEQPG